MRLSRKKAIKLCIELWTWLAKTGKKKVEWPEWEKYKAYNKPIDSHTTYDCWFCEYGYQRNTMSDRCKSCPYNRKYGHCFNPESYYDLWEEAKTPLIRKKYAKLFLEQIKKCK